MLFESIYPCFQVPKNVTIMFLQALGNKSVNMVKQLYYSKIHSKNIDLFKLYNSTYYVDDVIKNIASVNNINSECITITYITHASGCFV